MSTTIDQKFSAAAIQDFYTYLSEQFADILVRKADDKYSAEYKHNPITIYEVIQSFRNDKMAQQKFPAGIDSILTPLHLDTVHSLMGGWNALKAITAFKLLDHLTIDAGTPEFVKQLDNFAELMHHECRGSNRTCAFRYLEEVQKDRVPDDDNLVYLNYNGYSSSMSANELKYLKLRYQGLTEKQIQHFVKPSFEEGVLPDIIKERTADWNQQDYSGPPEDDNTYQLIRARSNTLQRHLELRIANQTQAALVFENLQIQIGEYGKYQRLELINLAIQNTDAGKYTNATVIDKLPEPKPVEIVSRPYVHIHYPALSDTQQSSSPNVNSGTMVNLVVGGTVLTAFCFLAWRAKSIGNWLNAISNAVSGVRKYGIYAQPAVIEEARTSKEAESQMLRMNIV